MIAPPRIILMILWAIGLIVISCGPGLIDDSIPRDTASPYSQSTDPIIRINPPGENDSDTGVPACPGKISSRCPSETGTFAAPDNVLISSDWLAFPARFTHGVKNVITGIFQTNSTQVPFAVYVDFDDIWEPADFSRNATVMTLPDSDPADTEWIGLISSNGNIFNSAYRYMGVLRQADSYRIVNIPRSGTATLNDTSWPALETAARLTGAVYLASKTSAIDSSLDTLCVFGNGLFCFNGENWITELTPKETVSPIVSVAVSYYQDSIYVHAITEYGEIHTRRNGEWSAYAVDVDSPLTSASVHEDKQVLFIAGDGRIVRCDSRYAMLPCELDIDVLDFHFYRHSPEFVLLADNGDLYSGQFDFVNQPAICGPLYHVEDAIDMFPAGLNLYVLTEDALYSTPDQGIVMIE